MALLYPYARLPESLLSGNMLGVLEIVQYVGCVRLFLMLLLSKSSRYEALPCTLWFCPAMSCANSPLNVSMLGCVHCMSGSLSKILVSHWLSFFQLRCTPQSVFFNGSLPMLTFVVRGCSFRYISVPPKVRFLLSS